MTSERKGTRHFFKGLSYVWVFCWNSYAPKKTLPPFNFEKIAVSPTATKSDKFQEMEGFRGMTAQKCLTVPKMYKNVVLIFFQNFYSEQGLVKTSTSHDHDLLPTLCKVGKNDDEPGTPNNHS